MSITVSLSDKVVILTKDELLRLKIDEYNRGYAQGKHETELGLKERMDEADKKNYQLGFAAGKFETQKQGVPFSQLEEEKKDAFIRGRESAFIELESLIRVRLNPPAMNHMAPTEEKGCAEVPQRQVGGQRNPDGGLCTVCGASTFRPTYQGKPV